MTTLAITTIQTNLHWQDKAANLQMFADKILSIKEKTGIIVLPEMFSTGFSLQPRELAESMNGPTVNWMKEMAAKKKAILTGSLIIKEPARASDPDGRQHYFNRLIWMLPNGQFGIYDKRHRFAFAGEDQHYTAGNKRLIASVNGWKINLQVCYDLRFPVWARQSAQNGITDTGSEYDVLVYVANWPETRSLAWTTLLRARAIENQCYVVGVNRVGTDGNDKYYSGDSMVIDPLGEILYHKKDDEDICTTLLNKEHLETVREKFPFWKDADRFEILSNDKG
jgi:predicted amidohydrolase